jgi:DNA-binding transcriptional ArsR family regulator
MAAVAKKGRSARTAAAVFAALGRETRLGLVAVLRTGGAKSIAQLILGTAMTRQAGTKHLLVLGESGLVRDVKLGRERRWQFDAARLDDTRRALGRIAARWHQELLRRKTSLEERRRVPR